MNEQVYAELVSDWVRSPLRLIEAIEIAEKGLRQELGGQKLVFSSHLLNMISRSGRNPQYEQWKLLRDGICHLTTIQSSNSTVLFLQTKAEPLYEYACAVCAIDSKRFDASICAADRAIEQIRARFAFGPATIRNSTESSDGDESVSSATDGDAEVDFGYMKNGQWYTSVIFRDKLNLSEADLSKAANQPNGKWNLGRRIRRKRPPGMRVYAYHVGDVADLVFARNRYTDAREKGNR